MIYQIIGIAIMMAFYICYFAKMMSQKKRGITTDQIGKGKVGTTKVIEILMKIATYLVPLAEAVSIIFGTTVFSTKIRVCGICMGVSGVIFFILSVTAMRDSWRAGVSMMDKTALVTNGIYRISRNPAFLGFDLMYIGILLMFFNPVLLVTSVFAVIMLHIQIVNVEEKFLISSFGDEYMGYKQKVCRYIGRKGCRDNGS